MELLRCGYGDGSQDSDGRRDRLYSELQSDFESGKSSCAFTKHMWQFVLDLYLICCELSGTMGVLIFIGVHQQSITPVYVFNAPLRVGGGIFGNSVSFGITFRRWIYHAAFPVSSLWAVSPGAGLKCRALSPAGCIKITTLETGWRMLSCRLLLALTAGTRPSFQLPFTSFRIAVQGVLNMQKKNASFTATMFL